MLADIVDAIKLYGVTCIPDDVLLHRVLEHDGYQVFENSWGWSGREWFAALPEFDTENWQIVLPDGTIWPGGETCVQETL